MPGAVSSDKVVDGRRWAVGVFDILLWVEVRIGLRLGSSVEAGIPSAAG